MVQPSAWLALITVPLLLDPLLLPPAHALRTPFRKIVRTTTVNALLALITVPLLLDPLLLPPAHALRTPIRRVVRTTTVNALLALITVPLLLDPLLLPPANALRTPFRKIIRTTTVNALLVFLPVPLLLDPLLLAPVCALRTPGPKVKVMTIPVHALHVPVPQILAQLLDPLLLPTAHAIKTHMEMPRQLTERALNVISVVLPLAEEIAILIRVVFALPTLILQMVPLAHSALLIPSPLVAIILTKHLAFAMLTFMEMPKPIHALHALMAVSL